MKNLFPTWLAPSLLLWMAVASSSAFAARPLNTDDANVVDPQSCQDESWVKKSKLSNKVS
jgi:hypothetical protein